MVRRTTYDAVGGFDESMEACGDVDLFLRICRQSKVAYVDSVTARYREHMGSLSVRHPEYSLIEADAFIAKLRTLEPNFDLSYGSEVTSFLLQRRKGLAVSSWRAGNPGAARRQLGSYFQALPQMAAIFLATFVPFEWATSVRRLMWRR